MANPAGVRLVEACESMCDQLRTALGLTSFRAALFAPELSGLLAETSL